MTAICVHVLIGENGPLDGCASADDIPMTIKPAVTAIALIEVLIWCTLIGAPPEHPHQFRLLLRAAKLNSYLDVFHQADYARAYHRVAWGEL